MGVKYVVCVRCVGGAARLPFSYSCVESYAPVSPSARPRGERYHRDQEEAGFMYDGSLHQVRAREGRTVHQCLFSLVAVVYWTH